MPQLLYVLAVAVVFGFCLFLIGLAVVIAVRPTAARRFVDLFASSARAHYTEQGLRLLVGAAIVTAAGSMRHPQWFPLFGWLIVVTAIALLLTPWQWHHRYGTWVIPLVIRHFRLFALGAAALGVLLLYELSPVVLL